MMTRAWLPLLFVTFTVAWACGSGTQHTAVSCNGNEETAIGTVRRSVVRISTDAAVGTGIVVAENQILTNAHVVGDNDKVRVETPDGAEEGTVVGTDKVVDLALIQAATHALPPVRFAEPSSLKQGQHLLAIGYALDLPGEPSTTGGMFSALREIDRVHYVQTDAPINPGNSGGPLFTLCGEVVGLNTVGLRAGIGLAIDSTALRTANRDLASVVGHDTPTLAAKSSSSSRNTATAEVSVSDKIPDSFPKDFPVYKGASVRGSYSGNSNGVSGTVVTWETGDGIDKVKEFYANAFKDGPWKSESNGDTGDSSFWSAQSPDGKKTAYLAVSKEGDKVSIVAAVTDTPQDGSSSSSSGSDSSSSSSGSSSDDKTATAEAKDSGSSSSSGPEKSPTSSPLPSEVKLPKDFPTDRVPLPSGARVTSSSSFSGGGSKTYSIEYYTKDAPDKAAEYFSTELSKHGWADSFSSNQNGEYSVTFSAGGSGASTNESVIVSTSASDTAGYAKVTLLVSVSGAP